MDREAEASRKRQYERLRRVTRAAPVVKHRKPVARMVRKRRELSRDQLSSSTNAASSVPLGGTVTSLSATTRARAAAGNASLIEVLPWRRLRPDVIRDGADTLPETTTYVSQRNNTSPSSKANPWKMEEAEQEAERQRVKYRSILTPALPPELLTVQPTKLRAAPVDLPHESLKQYYKSSEGFFTPVNEIDKLWTTTGTYNFYSLMEMAAAHGESQPGGGNEEDQSGSSSSSETASANSDEVFFDAQRERQRLDVLREAHTRSSKSPAASPQRTNSTAESTFKKIAAEIEKVAPPQDAKSSSDTEPPSPSADAPDAPSTGKESPPAGGVSPGGANSPIAKLRAAATRLRDVHGLQPSYTDPREWREKYFAMRMRHLSSQ